MVRSTKVSLQNAPVLCTCLAVSSISGRNYCGRQKKGGEETRRLQELQETRKKLQESEIHVDELKSQVTGFKNEVTDLKDQMARQGATMNKLMAYLESIGAQL